VTALKLRNDPSQVAPATAGADMAQGDAIVRTYDPAVGQSCVGEGCARSDQSGCG
jgi:hypothetical protein